MWPAHFVARAGRWIAQNGGHILAAVTTSYQLESMSSDQIAVHNANLMRDACLRAAGAAGTQCVYDSGELEDHVLGMFTGDPQPSSRIIIIRQGMDPLSEALVIAHEIGHLFDPALNTYAMEHYYARNMDTCEAVAHYASYLIADAFLLTPHIRQRWFDELIEEHCSVQAMIQSDAMVHRADVGALKVIPPEAAGNLRARRVEEGRPYSGMDNAQRVWRKFRDG